MNNNENRSDTLIRINKEKFSFINNKISNIFKEYYNLVDTYSYEINYIEKSINSFKPKKRLNIKTFIDNQQLLIKDLVNIINNLLFSIKIHSNKEKDSKNKRSIKSIIENNNTNINYLKNKINESDNNIIKSNNQIKLKTKNQIEENLSFINIKKRKKEIKINQYINKPKLNETNKNGLSSKNSTLSNAISFSTKNKSFLNNSNSILTDLNNIINANEIYKNQNKYNESIISPQIKKANKIRLTLSNYNNKKKDILNSSFQSNKSQKKEKMRKSASFKSIDKIPISISANSITNMIYRSRSKSVVPLKISDFSLKNEKIPYFSYNDTTSEDKEKKKGVLYIFSDNKINNMKNYDLDGKFHITPHRMTKAVLTTSYNILNKFEKKRKKDDAV